MTVNNTNIVSNIKNYIDTQNAFLPSVVHIPLEQENDVDFLPCVKPGDIVKEGQVIANGSGDFASSCIHSSVPGIVEKIEPSFLPNGKQGKCIDIKTKGSFSFLGHKAKETQLEYLSPAAIVSSIAEKGIINTFRTDNPKNLFGQLNNKKCTSIIVRLFDDEPERLTDSLISKFYFDEVIKGSEVLAKVCDAENIVFVFDLSFNNKDILAKITQKNYNILKLNIKKYPFGDKDQIIKTFEKDQAKKKTDYVISENDLFVDSSTAYDVFNGIVCNTPCVSRNVTFSGNCLYSSCMLNVRIGTSIREVIGQIGGFSKKPAGVIINGSFLGNSLQSLDTPITKYTKSVKVISSVRLSDSHIYACINCGSCRDACPQKLLPDVLYMSTYNDTELNESIIQSALKCTACAVCNCVCPSRLPLSHTIEVLKNRIKEEGGN